jgi:hypothetical protein
MVKSHLFGKKNSYVFYDCLAVEKEEFEKMEKAKTNKKGTPDDPEAKKGKAEDQLSRQPQEGSYH